MRICFFHILCCLPLALAKQDSVKCPVLNEEFCKQQDKCVWYNVAGCRELCNFRSSEGCQNFEDTGCVWNEDECIDVNSLQQQQETSNPTEKPILQPTKTPTSQPSLRPSFSPTDSPIDLTVSTGLVVYLYQEQETVQDFIPIVFESFKALVQYPDISRNPHEYSLCPRYYKPLVSQEMSQLCKTFLPYMNLNPYIQEKPGELIFSIEIFGFSVTDFESVSKIQNRIAVLLSDLKVELRDFHLASSLKSATNSRKPPNVVMMLADDLGWADVGFQACETENLGREASEKLCAPSSITPNIDEMASSQHSAKFSRFYTAPQCGPSRASFLTGRQPIRECMLFNVFRAVPEGEIHQMSPLKCVKTVAEAVKQTHPKVKSFHAGKWHVGKLHKDDDFEPDYTIAPPSENGFNSWLGTARHGPTVNFNCGCFDGNECNMGIYNNTYFWETLEEADGRSRKFSDQNDPNLFSCDHYYGNVESLDYSKYNSSQGHWQNAIKMDDSEFIVDRFESFLENEIDENPFFALLWFHAPHVPVVATKEYFERALKLVDSNEDDIDDFYCGLIFNENLKSVSPQDTCERILRREDNTKQRCSDICRELKAHYYGSVMALDDQVGRVRQLLKLHDVYEDTIIIFTSDNGPARYDASSFKRYLSPGSVGNLDAWKFSPLEGGTRVPFVLEYPRLIQQNKEINIPISSYDFLPTTLELLNAKYEQDKVLDGVSLVPFLLDDSQTSFGRSKPIVIVTVRMEKHYISNKSSIVRLEGQHKYRRYEFDENLNKMIEKDREGDNNLKKDKYNDLVSGYDNWLATVFDPSPCNTPAKFLKREEFCDMRLYE